jgi:hypothetical protein
VSSTLNAAPSTVFQATVAVAFRYSGPEELSTDIFTVEL